jgi:hypothetical protein
MTDAASAEFDWLVRRPRRGDKDFPVLGKTIWGTMVQHSPLARGSKPPVQEADVEPAPRKPWNRS